ncbi:MAG: pantoate--beta-alanine ligase [Aquificaceae bacterium]|nr:pantoate--beta-alanine ligase [Aquificaceae bacterium]MCX8164638.1 pantoate--beta-alanine ligase [Aquificaceae bacterium]
MPALFRKQREIRNYIKLHKCENGRTIGLVPTMGYLHEGHVRLIRESKMQNDITIVSIYVNPLQFAKGEDYERYPRDLQRDISVCEEESVDVVFAPMDEDMYPDKPLTKIEVEGLTNILEEKFRPGHFSGVCTVVLKLLNIIQPDRAYFGEKDYQQLKVVEKLVRDLSINTEIIPVSTVRDANGLAYSSRNSYLSAEERESALSLYRSFILADKLFKNGNKDSKLLKEAITDFILKHPHVRKIDYVEITDENLKPVQEVKEGDRILLAVWVGSTRLIDNWRIGYAEV